MMNDLAIRCHELKKSYPGRPPVEAVRGIDLEVPRGICFGLLGPNGAGKTTTIEILEGLLAPTSGEVELLGLNWNRNEYQIREQIGISLQETRLSERLTVWETLTLFSSFYPRGIGPAAAISRVSLQEKANARVGSLSGGQRQRLAVAAALVGNPQLLFLDEPTTGLDPASRRELWGIVKSLVSERRTVLLTTHYMEEAERLCDQIAIVDQGKIIALGSPAELIRSLGGKHIIQFSVRSSNSDSDSSIEPLAHAHQNDELWRSVPGTLDLRHDNGFISLSVAEPHISVPPLLRTIEANQLHLSSLTTRQASLDDVFIKLTGRRLDTADHP